MNRIFIPPPPWRSTTQAADGLPRRRWLVAEIEKMAEDGYFREDERFELVGGEIVPMSPKGIRHEAIRGALALHLARRTREDFFIISEPQFNLDDDMYLLPDILVHPAGIPTAKVRGGDALLVVEAADSSLSCDLNTKAPIYAAYGVREYWVIDAVTLATMVHRRPSGKAYEAVEEVEPDGMLSPLLVPAFTVSLRALPLHLD
jgi:Uma2 family endonuclease